MEWLRVYRPRHCSILCRCSRCKRRGDSSDDSQTGDISKLVGFASKTCLAFHGSLHKDDLEYPREGLKAYHRDP